MLNTIRNSKIPINFLLFKNGVKNKSYMATFEKSPVFTYQRLDHRVHSTQSDSHRQKVVINTNPIIEKKTFVNKLISTIDPYAKLARWDKPIGLYLLYWPCTWSIALATVPGIPLSTSLQTAAMFLVGAGAMRGAGCTINDIWDKDIDKQVARTKDRPLASGALTEKQAFLFLGAQLSIALAVLLQLNQYTVILGASSMLLVIIYPLAKRFTNYPQVVLGATFNWGVLMGYSALHGTLDLNLCGPLYLATLIWTVFYDTIYAHQDKKDDAKIGMRSTALTFGARTKPALTGALVTSAACLAYVGVTAELSQLYYMSLAAYITHLGRQIYTLDVDNPTDCANKFKSNSLVSIIILLGIIGGGYSKYIENRKKIKQKELDDSNLLVS